MANLGLIDFKLGLYIKVNVNAGQNKFEVHISKHLVKMAINWHKTTLKISGRVLASPPTPSSKSFFPK